jgi:hypothetical protein
MNTSTHPAQLAHQGTADHTDRWRPIRAAAQEAERVYELERVGESEWTPWIAIVALIVFFAVIGLLMFGIVEAGSHLLVSVTSEHWARTHFALARWHHCDVPDELDYRALARLLENPEAWSRSDFTAARAALAQQSRVVQESDPQDAKTRASLQDVADRLEAAIDTYVRSR